MHMKVEPRLSDPHRFKFTNPKSMYLFGSPLEALIVVAFSKGEQTPTVEFFGLDLVPNGLAAS
ncbi:MAG: hypothetical protein NTY42_16015 [Planctomycetota bacterium]|nr:hypothetical protein [Planctomycetota bacterium]